MWRVEKIREAIQRKEMVRNEESVSSWRIYRLLSKEIRIRFFQTAWFNLQTKLSWHSRRETNAHRISPGYSNFGTSPPLVASSPAILLRLKLILSFVFVRSPASSYSRFLSNRESPRLVNIFTQHDVPYKACSKSSCFFIRFRITTVLKDALRTKSKCNACMAYDWFISCGK